MNTLQKDMHAYEGMKAALEATHLGKWVLLYDGKKEGVFESFEQAASDAVRRFGRGPYLIRQVGAPPVTLPASVMYRPIYENDQVRV